MVCLGVCIEFACWFYFVLSICADEFPFEKKLRIAAVRAQFVFCQHCLYRVEQFGRNDRRKCISIFLSVMRVKADIAGVPQDLIDRIGQERLTSV